MSATHDTLLEPAELRLFEGLALRPSRSFEGRARGERLAKRKGLSIEFADYREYAEGDDLRHLDWNVLARLDHPIVKTYRDEQDLALYLLLDGSASMGFGDPTKLHAAKRISAALAMAALAGGDTAYTASTTVQERLKPHRSRSAFHRVAAWLEAIEPVGDKRLASAVRDLAATQARPGVVAIVTDGMDPDFESSLKLLRGRGHEVWVAIVLSPVELRPDIEGDLRLIDSESGDGVEITANSITMREYEGRLNAHIAALRAEAKRIGGRFYLFDAEAPLRAHVRAMIGEGWVGR